jgi:hypothetical protein
VPVCAPSGRGRVSRPLPFFHCELLKHILGGSFTQLPYHASPECVEGSTASVTAGEAGVPAVLTNIEASIDITSASPKGIGSAVEDVPLRREQYSASLEGMLCAEARTFRNTGCLLHQLGPLIHEEKFRVLRAL